MEYNQYSEKDFQLRLYYQFLNLRLTFWIDLKNQTAEQYAPFLGQTIGKLKERIEIINYLFFKLIERIW
jgi:hypothetical protein